MRIFGLNQRTSAKLARRGPTQRSAVARQTISFPGFSVLRDRLPNLCFSLLIFITFIGISPLTTGDYSGDGALSGTGDSARQATFIMMFVLIVATAVLTKGAQFLLEVPIALAVLLLWCWASVTWAIEPAVSFRRVLFTTIVVLSVVYCVNMLSYQQVMSSLAGWFALIVLLDWLTVQIITNAIHQANEAEPLLAGNWRGIHTHKNEAGALCAIAALLFGDLAFRSRSFITAPALAALSVGFLVMTQSKTSEGAVIVAALVGLFIDRGYRNPVLRNILSIVGLCVLILLAIGFGDQAVELMAFLDDPGSLTGRVQIWPVLFRYAADHLLLGSGYGSFWAIGSASPVYEDGAEWLTTIAHAHNGYIDLLVQIGLVGLVTAVFALVVRPLYILTTQPLPPPQSRWLLASIISFCLFHDLLESSLLDRSNIIWIIMLIAYSLVERRPLRTDIPTAQTVAQ